MKVLGLPIPILVAVILPQVDKPPTDVPGMSLGTTGSLILGTVFLVLWFLNAIGKLPGNGANRRRQAFTSEDRAQVQKITDLLAERIGDDGLERYLVQAQQTREIHECMLEVAKSMEQMSRHMEVLSGHVQRRG